MVTKTVKKHKAPAKKATKTNVQAVAEAVHKVKQQVARASVPATKHSYIATVGRRKEAVARVRLFPGGKGEFIINTRPLVQYFTHFDNQMVVLQPLKLLGLEDKFNVQVKVLGGGKTGQAEAIRHGISRALLLVDPAHRAALKPQGLLTRDSRVKERKKPGLKKARRAPQFSKR